MKSIFLFNVTLILFFLHSCADKNESLIEENVKLRQRNAQLELKLKNALVIEYDSLQNYIVPVTFGHPNFAVGTRDTFQIYLALHRLPRGIEVKFELLDNSSELLSGGNANELTSSVVSKNDSSGIKKVLGKYVLKYSNGKSLDKLWLRQTTVK